MPRLPRLPWFIPLTLLLTAATNDLADSLYTASGALRVPQDYRDWVFLTSGLDMDYTDESAPRDHSMFDNVFVDPAAWRVFKKIGHWPDPTILVKEVRGANTHGSINKSGHYQTELMEVEFHVHDAQKFKGGWAFFVAGVDPGNAVQSAGERMPDSAPCYSCHRDHGATDSTFTQFYPTARPVAEHAGTFRTD